MVYDHDQVLTAGKYPPVRFKALLHKNPKVNQYAKNPFFRYPSRTRGILSRRGYPSLVHMHKGQVQTMKKHDHGLRSNPRSRYGSDKKMEKLIPLTITASGDRVFPVGGGGYTKTFVFRTVIDQAGNLKPAFYIRTSGSLSCELDQAYVQVQAGDLVMTGSGTRPFNFNDPALDVHFWRIVSVNGESVKAIQEDDPDLINRIPSGTIERIRQGVNAYHNRDGSLFVRGDLNG